MLYITFTIMLHSSFDIHYIGFFLHLDTKPTEPIKTPLTNLIGKDTSQQKKEQDDEEEAKRTREASWRTMKYTLIIFGVSITCLGAYLVVELGKPTVLEDGTILRDEFTHLPMWKQYIYRFLREVDYYKRVSRFILIEIFINNS